MENCFTQMQGLGWLYIKLVESLFLISLGTFTSTKRFIAKEGGILVHLFHADILNFSSKIILEYTAISDIASSVYSKILLVHFAD